MKRTILLTLFALLFIADTLGIDLMLVRGLSAKNVVLYLFLFGLMLESILDANPKKIDLLEVHLPFVALIAYSLIAWLFFTHANILELSYQTKSGDFNEFTSLTRIKSFLIDRYAFFLAFFYGVATIDDSRWVIKRIIWLIIAGNVLTLIDAFNIPDLGIIQQRDDSRVTGPLGESNQYAAFSLLFLPSMAILAIMSRGAARVWNTFGTLATVTVIILTTSRGAIVGLTAGLMAGLFFMRHNIGAARMMKVIAGLTVAVAVAVAVASIGFSDLLTERFVNKTGASDLSTVSSGRTDNWARLVDLQLAEPITLLFGYGWGMSLRLNDVATHNTYLEYIFDLGIIGLLILCRLLWGIIRNTRRAIERTTGDVQAELGAFLIGFSSLCVAIFFLNLDTPWYYIWAFCGLMMRTALEADRAQPKESRASGSVATLQAQVVFPPPSSGTRGNQLLRPKHYRR
ncbi:MAG: O-antigen ligase family protein [Gammaproteobacteria bacterium]